MAYHPALGLLRALLRCVPFRHLVRYCRHLLVIVWRSLRKCASSGADHSLCSPPQTPHPGHLTGSITPECFGLVEPGRDVSCLEGHGAAHSIPYAASEASETLSIDIALQVLPPSESAVSEYEGLAPSIYGASSLQGDSTTLADRPEHNMARQIYLSQPSLNGSCISVVLPAAPTLQHESTVAQLGNPGALSSSDEISRFIYPMMPSKIPRYERGRTIEPKEATFNLPPAQKSFSLDGIPKGWIQLTQPEGQPYFYHPQKRIITEEWICDSNQMTALDSFIAQIDDFTRSKNLYQPDDTDLVLEYSEVAGEAWCGYYYVCHSTRSLFWLEKYDISGFLNQVRGELHPTHIKAYLEYQYWVHWDLFPNVNKPTIELFHMAANTIADARTDVLTSGQSTVNHTMETLKEMAAIVEGAARRMKHAPSTVPSTTWCIGRFMAMLTHDQFLNFHGQYGARLNQSQSIHGNKPPERSWLITFLSPLLFCAPDAHLKAMEDLWVDRLTLKPRWAELFAKLNVQWGEHIVHASILLTASVTFLATPSVDPSNGASKVIPTRSPPQIAGYLAVVTSFGSMMLALLLVRQHKTRECSSIMELHTFLRKRHRRTRGLETLAIMYSLPFALLMWGLVTFFVAFILMCLDISTALPRAVVGLATVSVCTLIGWCIWMAWEETDFHWWEWLKAKMTWTTGGGGSNTNTGTGVLRWTGWVRGWRVGTRFCLWRKRKVISQPFSS